jgi:dienelactone hydrolase
MKWHDRWRVARMALFSRVISPMISCRNVLRAFGLILTLLPITSTPLAAGELVQFDTISGDAGSLKLLGYLARPLRPEADPSPAVVILHGCGGFDDRVVAWADRLSLLWGYVALAVDSFGPRKVPRDCTSHTYQEFDASSAFDFLAKQNFVDSSRAAVLGFSQGAMATLRNAEQDSAFAKSHPGTFRAAVAFYPNCSGISGIMAVPTLVLTGELDDWTPAKECQAMAEGRSDVGTRREKADRSMISLVVYPGAYHDFNAPILRSLTQVKGVRFMGHWLEYNAEADSASVEKVKLFLRSNLQ